MRLVDKEKEGRRRMKKPVDAMTMIIRYEDRGMEKPNTDEVPRRNKSEEDMKRLK